MWNTLDPVSVATLQRYPTVKSDICICMKSTSRNRGATCCILWSQLFCAFLRKWKACFLNTSRRNWESMVTLQLLSGSWVVFWTNESEKNEILLLFVQTYLNWKSFHICQCYVTLSREDWFSLYGNVTWQWQKKRIKTQFLAPNFFKTFIVKINSFFLATSVLSHPPMAYNTTA